jgi:hypothetical protein
MLSSQVIFTGDKSCCHFVYVIPENFPISGESGNILISFLNWGHANAIFHTVVPNYCGEKRSIS